MDDEPGMPREIRDAREIVAAFVRTINAGRADAVAGAMARDGVFIDSLGTRIEGYKALLEAWRAYYRMFPDFRIEVERVIAEDRDAMLHGQASGTLHRGGRAVEGGGWRMPAAWRAVTDAKKVLLWQVFADNEPVRAAIGR